jgi:cytochrome bd-type quinol oxidase subunit 2
MYSTLLFLHSIGRWLVLISLLYAILRAYKGYRFSLPFTKRDNAIRHWTATIAHLQLMIGMVLYSQSPLIKMFFSRSTHENESSEPLFFAIIHLAIMMVAIIVITIGSALAKRKGSDQEKFTVMLYWFAAALLLIFLAIPWPFSPLAHRPYLRPL